jgi:hypothetical protein
LGLSLVLMWWVWCEGLRSWEQASFKIGFGTDPRDLFRVESMIGTSTPARRGGGGSLIQCMMA